MPAYLDHGRCSFIDPKSKTLMGGRCSQGVQNGIG